MSHRPRPEEVFTPRASTVNEEMYVNRELLESALTKALRKNLHILMHGQSGTGKSWLYKRTLELLDLPFIVANLANASRLGSITAELQNVVQREGRASKVGYTENKSAEVNALLAKAELSHSADYEIGKKEPFEDVLRLLSEKSGGKTSVLVLDNLEAIFNEKHLKELADLITLCDDERYAQYNVKLLIVGVPSEVKSYYYKTPTTTTVANRLDELPEISKLSKEECDELIERGFVEKLRYSVDDLAKFKSHIRWITGGIPQLVHEYCLEVAIIAEDSQHVDPPVTHIAEKEWLKRSHYFAYSAIESHMNERDTKAGRRNQTLLALGECTTEEFKPSDIEEIMRKIFPISTVNTMLNAAQNLASLASGDRPVVKRSSKGDAFYFADPRYRHVIRAMLRVNEDERVERVAVEISSAG